MKEIKFSKIQDKYSYKYIRLNYTLYIKPSTYPHLFTGWHLRIEDTKLIRITRFIQQKR